MDYRDFASDLPAHGNIVFTSAEENQATMKELEIEQEIRQLGPGKFRCDLAVRGTQQADLVADRLNKSFSMYLASPKGTVGLVLFRSANGRFLAAGENVAYEKLVVLPDGAGTDFISPGMVGSESIVVPYERFLETTHTLCPAYAMPEGFTVIQGDNAKLDELRQTILRLLAQPNELDPEEISNLIAASIVWMYCFSTEPKAPSNRDRPRIARRARDYIEAHYREPVHLEDLCRVTGVGVRTLQRSFREYFDITISAYLKAVRLDAAHRELVKAHPSEQTIASIALRNGLSHFGRFSVDFRKRFGELPSQTLAAQPGHKS